MTQISLTKERRAFVGTARSEFLLTGNITQPADFKTAEAAITNLYEMIGVKAPRFIHLPSPLAAEIYLHTLQRVSAQNGAKKPDVETLHKTADKVHKDVCKPMWDAIVKEMGEKSQNRLAKSLEQNLHEHLVPHLFDRLSAGSSTRQKLQKEFIEENYVAFWQQLRDEAFEDLAPRIKEALASDMQDVLWQQFWDPMTAQIWTQVGQPLRDAMERFSALHFDTWFWGQHDSLWFWTQTAQQLGVPFSEHQQRKIRLFVEIGCNAGWWFPFPSFCIITDRTSILTRDQNQMLHGEETFAAQYPDGFGVAAWHGTRLPSKWVEERTTIDPSQVLRAENVEQRAAGAAVIGWPRMLEVLKAKVINDSGSEDIGQLIELTLPGLSEPGRFLKARCPRNGIIVEGVPYVSDIDGKPIETALAAQAWRIGDPQSEYIHPDTRT